MRILRKELSGGLRVEEVRSQKQEAYLECEKNSYEKQRLVVNPPLDSDMFKRLRDLKAKGITPPIEIMRLLENAKNSKAKLYL